MVCCAIRIAPNTARGYLHNINYFISCNGSQDGWLKLMLWAAGTVSQLFGKMAFIFQSAVCSLGFHSIQTIVNILKFQLPGWLDGAMRNSFHFKYFIFAWLIIIINIQWEMQINKNLIYVVVFVLSCRLHRIFSDMNIEIGDRFLVLLAFHATNINTLAVMRVILNLLWAICGVRETCLENVWKIHRIYW